MDALFSLPALSFLIIPTFSSYSTSLNLLFFYLTWSTLVLSHPPLKVEILGTLAVRVLFYILPSTLFLFFDGVLPSAAVGLKAQGDVALPSSGGKGRWWKVASVSVGNVLLSVAVQAGVEALFTEVLHIRSALKVTTTLPMPWGIAKDLLRGLLLREVGSMYLAGFHNALMVSSGPAILPSPLCSSFAELTTERSSPVMVSFSWGSLFDGCALRSPACRSPHPLRTSLPTSRPLSLPLAHLSSLPCAHQHRRDFRVFWIFRLAE